MTRPARGILSVSIALAMAAGVLLAPARAGAAGPASRHPSAAPSSQRIDPGELQQLLDQIVAAGAPGVAAWVRDEGGVQQAASGVADLRTGRPMRADLHYRAGSLTKALVATVVLQLVAEGRLSLQDTVARWLPGILPYGDQVTVEQLLRHISGVPDYTPPVFLSLYGSRQARFRSWTPQELVGVVADQPPLFPPGTATSYSNTGYILLGLIVEAATGHTVGHELDRRILRPLGLRDTFFPVNAPGLPSPKARGYSVPVSPQGQLLAGPLLDFTIYNPSFAWAAGSLISTFADLARFFRALLGGRLLPPRLLAEMATPNPTSPPPIREAMGLEVLELPSGHLVGHAGDVLGFSNAVFSTQDGRQQFGLMRNLNLAPPAVQAADMQARIQIASRLLEEAG
jgi:D-alanyl-D-alanine carboxypeptidase